MNVDPNFVPYEQRMQNHNPVVDATSYQYTRMDRLKDALAATVLSIGFFIAIWIAFALDVITTGM